MNHINCGPVLGLDSDHGHDQNKKLLVGYSNGDLKPDQRSPVLGWRSDDQTEISPVFR